MSKVISIQDHAYETLAMAQGKLNLLTRQPNSLSSTVSMSLLIVDTWLQRVMEESKKDRRYGEELARAVKKMDRQELIELLIDALKSD